MLRAGAERKRGPSLPGTLLAIRKHMFNLILGYTAFMIATLFLAGTGIMGHAAKETFIDIFTYDGPASFIKVPLALALTFVIAVFPGTYLLMVSLGIFHIYMPTIFVESYSFYDSLHIYLGLTFLTAPWVIGRRMAMHQSRNDYKYE